MRLKFSLSGINCEFSSLKNLGYTVFKFGRNQLVVLEIWKTEFGNFTVLVNKTLVCCTSSFVFLAADGLLLPANCQNSWPQLFCTRGVLIEYRVHSATILCTISLYNVATQCHYICTHVTL